MYKKSLILILLLIFNFNYSQNVIIEIQNLKANGISIPSSSSINFNNDASLNLNFDVKLSTFDGNYNNILGNLFVFTKKLTSGAYSQITSNAVTFTVLNPPFVSQTTYTSTTNFSITINKNEFSQSGGDLKIEYKNNNNESYFINKQIIGGSINDSGVYQSQLISKKYDNEMPIINNTILIPLSIRENNYSPEIRKISLAFNFNLPYVDNPNNRETYIRLFLKTKDSGTKTLATYTTYETSISNLTTYFNNIEILSQDIDDNSSIFIRVESFNRRWENFTYNLKVRNSSPILENYIADNQYINSNQNCTPLTSLQPIYELNTSSINYIWQKRSSSTNNVWTNISNTNFKDYYPNNLFTETTFYRRVTYLSNGLFSISNEIGVFVDDIINNQICCNQNLPSTSSQPNTVIGSTPNFTLPFIYQWQIAKSTSGIVKWYDINDTNQKDLNHFFDYTCTRGNCFSLFRRLIISNNNIVSFSNKIEIKRGNRNKLQDNFSELENLQFDDLIIYPNPLNSILNIDFQNNQYEKILIYDNTGRELKKIHIEQNLKKISINISNFENGVYLVVLINKNGDSKSKKIIKE